MKKVRNGALCSDFSKVIKAAHAAKKDGYSYRVKIPASWKR